jgi:pre-mRNA-processing factor SLU7
MNHQVNKDRKKLVTEEPQVKAPPKTAEELDGTLNPYMPMGIQKIPWYLPKDHHSLKPNIQPKQSDITNWYQRGQKTQIATKYRKGACENCGAMSHKARDCLERPRKKGAKWTGEDIRPDEAMLDDMKLGFEAKRDRWNGFNPAEQLELVKEWELVEKKRQEVREQKTKEKLERAGQRALQRQQGIQVESSDDSDDDDKYAEKMGQIGQKMDWILDARVTIRNLRIREDTAKYLRNLDLDSASYDPKSRQMMENPYKNKDPSETLYAGDGFERYTGQVKQVQDIQGFAWEADKKGLQFAMEANPTQGEILYKKFKETTTQVKSKTKGSLLEKYGGAEHLDVPKELMLAQSEQYVEYDPTGKVKVGIEIKTVKSKYPEDMYYYTNLVIIKTIPLYGVLIGPTSNGDTLVVIQQSNNHIVEVKLPLKQKMQAKNYSKRI